MTEIMRRQNELFAEGPAAKTVPLDAKRVALGVMQITNGTALLKCDLVRIDHDMKFVISKSEDQNYIAVLSGQVMCLAGEECPAMNPGEVYWVNSADDAILLNKSGDDAVVLCVTVKVD